MDRAVGHWLQASRLHAPLAERTVLERDHGWERDQSNDWLIRMGLWEEDLPTGA